MDAARNGLAVPSFRFFYFSKAEILSRSGTWRDLRGWPVGNTARPQIQMEEIRATGKALLLYVCGLLALAAIFFVGLSLVLPGVDTAASVPEREPTRMDVMVANAREIRAALLKPLPSPEPLGPITQKPTHAVKAVAKSSPRRPQREALEAYASGAPATSGWSPASLAAPGGEFDRHKPR